MIESFQQPSNFRHRWTDYLARAINGPVVGQERYHKTARRHLDGSNYLFADGHAKWYAPRSMTCNDPDASNTPTFKMNPADADSCT
jgi:prepilin-type processing-associated H-X9-DG protein